MNKIPPEAFDFYFSLGPGRSYQAVAEKYGVTKKAVTNLAKRENWQQRLADIEAKAREEADQQKADESKRAHEHRMKALRLVLGKGVEALQRLSFESPADAARAVGLAVKEMRVELDEPSERTAVSVEETIRREYARWMIVGGEEEESTAARIDPAS